MRLPRSVRACLGAAAARPRAWRLPTGRAHPPAWSGAKRIDRLGVVLVASITGGLCLMAGRVASLQVNPGDAVPAPAMEHMASRPVPAMRGEILDRRGRLVATSHLGYRLFVDPQLFPSPPDEAIVEIADTLGLDAAEFGHDILAAQEQNSQRHPRPDEKPKPDEDRVRRELLAMILQRLRLTPAPEPPPEEHTVRERGPIRYVRIGGVLSEEQVDRARQLETPGLHLERQSVREHPGGNLVASIVGAVNVDHAGSLGAEAALDSRLLGADGSVRYVRDARGRPLWIEAGDIKPAQRGQSVRLSIDLALQQVAAEELERGVRDADAAGGRVVVLDSHTGEILAMTDLIREVPGLAEFPWEDKSQPPRATPPWGLDKPRFRTVMPDPLREKFRPLARNRCLQDVYEPGSTFKPFVWAVVTDLGRAQPGEVFNTGSGRWWTSYGRLIRDVHPHASQTWAQVLINSSNIGMVKGAERLKPAELHGALVRYGFGERTGSGLPEAAGMVTALRQWNKYSHTSVAFGGEVAVTAVQMARAFAVFARPGTLSGTLPPARITAADEGDARGVVVPRVISADAAMLTRHTMASVTEKVEEKMAAFKPPETGWRYRMFGKSGTPEIPLGAPPAGKRKPRWIKGYYPQQYNPCFIAAGPTEDPRIVVIVIIEDPAPALIRGNRYYGSSVVGPVVRRVMERSLTYLGAPPSAGWERMAQAQTPR